MKKLVFITLFFLLLSGRSYADKVTITDNWKFSTENKEHFADASYNDTSWETVHLPHTWNDKDLIDESRGYRRAAAWYRKQLYIPQSMQDQKVFLRFEGVGSKADIYLNGKHLKTHMGAYTTFTVDITDVCHFGENNVLAVKADNSSSLGEVLPPVSGDFSMSGGIYRRVFLESYNKVHFDFEPYTSTPVLIQTPQVSAEKAQMNVKANVKNETNHSRKITVTFTLQDKDRNIIKEEKKKMTLKAGQTIPVSVTMDNIFHPQLWSPESPYLYTVKAVIRDDKDNSVLQQTESSMGFRWFSVDETGFYLNGNYIKLRGAARHQDYWGLGVAIPSEINYNDMKSLKEMGANFVRISHYPQDPEVYRACDELGLIAWSEICIVNEVKKNEEFAHNCKEMQKEMIYQNYNHPCVVMWGAMNELWDYHNEAIVLAKDLEKLTKELDPYRLSCVAFHAFTWEKPYQQESKEMFGISDINGVNVYEGWYHGDFTTIGPMFDKFRTYSESKPRFLSEYGAGSDERIHSYSPSVFDFTPEYQVAFNRAYINEMEARADYVGYSIWNFIDFQVDGRGDSKPNLNQKGMVYADRKKKEVYYYYQARWSDIPMIHMAGHDWTDRVEVCDTEINRRPVTVFSNQKEVEIFHCGKSLGTQPVINGEAHFVVPFVNGKNRLEARSGELIDCLEIDMTLLPSQLSKHTHLNEGLYINTGQDHCYFRDPLTGKTWLPDQPYQTGGWGYVTGEPFRSWPGSTHDGVKCGVGANIKNTDLEPLFQTFLLGVDSYRVDVSEGVYEVTLCFTEPFNEHERKKEPQRTGSDENGERVFDVSLNGTTYIHALNLQKEYGHQTAVARTFVIHVDNGQGLDIQFHPQRGQSVVSGIKVIKIN